MKPNLIEIYCKYLFFQRNGNFTLTPSLEAFHLTHWGWVLHPLDHLMMWWSWWVIKMVMVNKVVRVVFMIAMVVTLMRGMEYSQLLS